MGRAPLPVRVMAVAIVAIAAVTLALAASVLGGCGSGSKSPDFAELILATTTSVKDSGLLDDVVLPAFGSAHPGITVKTVAVGSGEAIAMGQRGDADVLIVHSPTDEEAFMADGYGTLLLPVAYNYFTIVGPEDDPAGIASAATAAEAMKRIAQKGALFVSRGDKSGTNKKELKLWNAGGVTADPTQPPEGSWYVSTGQGMGETLQVASEKQGYTLTDLATYLTMKSTLDLAPLVKKSDDLRNQYDVIIVNQAKFATVNAAGAEFLAAYLTSPEGQQAIGAYGEAKFGERLFYPDATTLGTTSP